MNRIRPLLNAVLLLCLVSARAQEVVFSTPGGFYDKAFLLTLSCDQHDKVIHYTTNGNAPTANDSTYHGPLFLDERFNSCSDIYTIRNCPDDLWYLSDSVQKCIVIRAAAFNEAGERIGDVVTNTYLIKSLGCNPHGLPVVSICADSLDLFGYETGIFVPGIHFDSLNPLWSGNYYQNGREWERPTNIEFYELDNTGINQIAGLRIHGKNGRRIQQKCLKIYAREEYGKKRFEHKFFEGLPCNSFKHLVLKPFSASLCQSGVNNHICNQIASQLNLESLASRPALLYINGEYWGVYYIHEKPDERFLEDHYHVDKDKVNIIENWGEKCEVGTIDNFLELYDYVSHSDLNDPDVFSYVASQIDINNFIDYQIFEIFNANYDWPANNVRCWQEDDGPWRWIFFDGDVSLTWTNFDGLGNATYNGQGNYPSSNSNSTLFFRKLLENESFKVAFINSFNQLLGSAFTYKTTKVYVDQIFETLKGEIPNQIARFNIPDSFQNWENQMASIDAFLSGRETFVVEQMNNYFLAADFDLTIDALYPSPTQNEITIRTNFDKTAQTPIQIFDLTGRMRLCKDWVFGAGESELKLPIQLTSGIYILRIGEKARKFVVIN